MQIMYLMQTTGMHYNANIDAVLVTNKCKCYVIYMQPNGQVHIKLSRNMWMNEYYTSVQINIIDLNIWRE